MIETRIRHKCKDVKKIALVNYNLHLDIVEMNLVVGYPHSLFFCRIADCCNMLRTNISFPER